MDDYRIHRVTSADGTEIAGRVQGQGAPLVLLPAGPGDSMLSWRHLVPLLNEHFTCYMMDTRGRGLSANNPDYSPRRLVEDVVAFAESVAVPVGLVGWGTALWSLVAAENSTAISAVAAYEPGATQVMRDEIGSFFEQALTRMGELAAEGRLNDAAQSFVEGSEVLYTADDLATGTAAEFWQAAAPNLPVFLQEEMQAVESELPSPTDPALLEKVAVPVLLLHGSNSNPWFADSVRHIADHVAEPHVREIPGAAHFGPYVKPDAIAEELIRFFERF